MAHVFVHVRKEPHHPWTNERADFNRIPCVGEYFAIDVTSQWYRVQLVTHCPFDHADFDAEVFAIEADQMEVINSLGKVLSDVAVSFDDLPDDEA